MIVEVCKITLLLCIKKEIIWSNRKTICFLYQYCIWFYHCVRRINVTFKDVIIQMVFRSKSIFRTNIITLERMLPAVFDFHLLRTVFACGKKKFGYKGSVWYLYLKSISSISFFLPITYNLHLVWKASWKCPKHTREYLI